MPEYYIPLAEVEEDDANQHNTYGNESTSTTVAKYTPQALKQARLVCTVGIIILVGRGYKLRCMGHFSIAAERRLL